MTVGALRLLFVMAVWTSCFPLIINGLDLAPHLVFAALRAARRLSASAKVNSCDLRVQRTVMHRGGTDDLQPSRSCSSATPAVLIAGRNVGTNKILYSPRSAKKPSKDCDHPKGWEPNLWNGPLPPTSPAVPAPRLLSPLFWQSGEILQMSVTCRHPVIFSGSWYRWAPSNGHSRCISPC